MDQAVPEVGSAQAKQPEAPLWPNESGRPGGPQCGCFSPRSSGPSPHGQGCQIIGATNPPPRLPVWLRIASARVGSRKNPAGTFKKARTSASAPAALVMSPPQGIARERQKGELN